MTSYTKSRWAAALGTALCSLFLVPAVYAADAPKNLKELVEAAKKQTNFRAMPPTSSLNGGKGFAQVVAAMNKILRQPTSSRSSRRAPA